MKTHYAEALRIATELRKVVTKHRGAAKNQNMILRCTSLADRIDRAAPVFAEDSGVIKELLRTFYSDDLHKRVIGGAPIIHASLIGRIDRIIQQAPRKRARTSTAAAVRLRAKCVFARTALA